MSKDTRVGACGLKVAFCFNMSKKLTQEEFVARATQVHNGTYDYSLSKYLNGKTEVRIICPIHGEFLQKAHNHLLGYGCTKCGRDSTSKKQTKTREDFIRKAQKIHSNKYDYSKVEYVNNRSKVCIVCPEHGEFLQIPDKHLQGEGCPKCCTKNRRYTTEEFIQRAKEIHGDKYDYSKTKYGYNKKDKITITCPIHGDFFITPRTVNM